MWSSKYTWQANRRIRSFPDSDLMVLKIEQVRNEHQDDQTSYQAVTEALDNVTREVAHDDKRLINCQGQFSSAA